MPSGYTKLSQSDFYRLCQYLGEHWEEYQNRQEKPRKYEVANEASAHLDANVSLDAITRAMGAVGLDDLWPRRKRAADKGESAEISQRLTEIETGLGEVHSAQVDHRIAAAVAHSEYHVRFERIEKKHKVLRSDLTQKLDSMVSGEAHAKLHAELQAEMAELVTGLANMAKRLFALEKVMNHPKEGTDAHEPV